MARICGGTSIVKEFFKHLLPRGVVATPHVFSTDASTRVGMHTAPSADAYFLKNCRAVCAFPSFIPPYFFPLFTLHTLVTWTRHPLDRARCEGERLAGKAKRLAFQAFHWYLSSDCVFMRAENLENKLCHTPGRSFLKGRWHHRNPSKFLERNERCTRSII